MLICAATATSQITAFEDTDRRIPERQIRTGFTERDGTLSAPESERQITPPGDRLRARNQPGSLWTRPLAGLLFGLRVLTRTARTAAMLQSSRGRLTWQSGMRTYDRPRQ